MKNKARAKKFFSILILTAFCMLNFNMAALCAPAQAKNYKKVYYGSVKKTVKIKKEEKKPEFQIPLVADELADSLNKNMFVKEAYKQKIWEDEALQAELKNKKYEKISYKTQNISDEEIILTEEDQTFKKPVYKGIFKTENGEAVVLKPIKKVRTKCSRILVKHSDGCERHKYAMPELGEKIKFKVVRDVIKNDKVVIPKDSIVTARVGEVSPRAMGGAPAEMTIERFEAKDKDGKTVPLNGKISSSGYSLSVWIGLAEIATTPFIFGLAVPLLRVLPGGQAVVSPKKEYIVYY